MGSLHSSHKWEENGVNRAVVFIKPHAIKAIPFVKEHLLNNGIRIVKEMSRKGEDLDNHIDQHYKTLYEPAMVHGPRELKVSEETKSKFFNTFGESWDDVVETDRIVNANHFKELYNYVEIGNEWDGNETIKVPVAPGAVVGKLKGADAKHGKDHHYIVNGFYLDMREKFAKKNAVVHFFLVEFEESKVSWHRFRKDIIGATNPTKAKEGSLRNRIHQNWKELGLKEEPNYGDNGVHASAGPIEAMRERLIWTTKSSEKDPFSDDRIKKDPVGRHLVKSGIEIDIIRNLLNNVVLEVEDGKEVPAFDETEDMDTSAGIQRILTIHSKSGKSEI